MATLVNMCTEAASKSELFAGAPDVLSVSAVAELLGVSAKLVRAEIARGKLPSCKVGARVLVTKTDLCGYLEASRA